MEALFQFDTDSVSSVVAWFTTAVFPHKFRLAVVDVSGEYRAGWFAVNGIVLFVFWAFYIVIKKRELFKQPTKEPSTTIEVTPW